ncbi:hypothetical protein EV421DRAFT_2041918 [Armillaria borealis]|uniref:Uncharacterized protein n=1 Tax=Armillaria borealis TaxID=47425 RepID=A0AA39IV24_9AGAR|nr:hypothetical protein EV421DRAFT_2041918 [Armillaria borealis]
MSNLAPKQQKKKANIKKPVNEDTPLQKGWAAGTGETFLETQVTQYTNAHQISRSKGQEVGDTVTNKFMEMFPWKTPRSKEAIEARVKKMHNGVQNWLKRHTNKIDKTPMQKQCSTNPLHLLLSKIAELWAKDHFDDYQEEFDAEFTSSRRSKAGQPLAYQAFIKARFEGEDEETQAEYEEQAEEESKELQQVRKSQDFEPFLLDPVAMQGSVVFAGPDPWKGGQLNAFYMHQGENKESIPCRFDLAGKARYKSFTSAYLSFIDRCYDREE